MSKPSWILSSVAVIAVLLVWGCTDTPTAARSSQTLSNVQPMCQLGCVDVDPAPNAPGIFLGHAYTPDFCFDNGTDLDQDGMNDFCEKQLSERFAPELYYWAFDDVRREPYWAARQLSGDKARIYYLFSYYRDEGSNTWLCNLPGAPSSCHGHNGDSEGVAFDIQYNASTEHWVLETAYYSEHDDWAIYRSVGTYPQQLSYPTHPGAYPLVWVSMGKHANYADQGECNSGGALGTDDCSYNDTGVRLEWSMYWNLGSSTAHMIDTVASRNPNYEYYGSGKIEAFWTGSEFRGWVPWTLGGDAASAYGPKLAYFGF